MWDSTGVGQVTEIYVRYMTIKEVNKEDEEGRGLEIYVNLWWTIEVNVHIVVEHALYMFYLRSNEGPSDEWWGTDRVLHLLC